MKAVIGVYDSHDKAVDAVKKLQSSGYPENMLSVIGQASKINDHMHVKSGSGVEGTEVGIGVVAGSILGVLTGVGIFAIPGLGFLYGAGALVGAFAGLDIGLLGGGLVAIFTQMGMDKSKASQYETYLKEGKFLVLAQGDADQISKAEDTLDTHGTHLELDTQ